MCEEFEVTQNTKLNCALVRLPCKIKRLGDKKGPFRGCHIQSVNPPSLQVTSRGALEQTWLLLGLSLQ